MKIFANTALLPAGWQTSVELVIDHNGTIANVTTEASGESADHMVDVLLPAPANLHSHAFQRAMAGMTEHRGPDPRDSFWTWRKLMYRFLDQLTPQDIHAITALVQMEMLESGYAAVGEFHYLHNRSDGKTYDNPAELGEQVASAANDTGIGLTLLPVLYEHGGCDGRALGAGQRRFGNTIESFESLYAGAQRALQSLPDDAQLGVAPHSLRAVSRESLQRATQIAPDQPFHIHVAEQDLEVEEVENAWGLRPVEWLLDNHALDSRWCLIHCTQMLSHETEGLAKSGAVAGLCPITESSLGDGIFEAQAFLQAGGSIGVGSDSNIRISLAEELRTLEYSQRLRDKSRAVLASAEHSTGMRLFDAINAGGARACKRNSGSLAEGRLADLVAIDRAGVYLHGASDDAILDHWFFAGDDHVVSDVWAAGRHQVRGGRHIARDAIVENYLRTLSGLRDRL